MVLQSFFFLFVTGRYLLITPLLWLIYGKIKLHRYSLIIFLVWVGKKALQGSLYGKFSDDFFEWLTYPMVVICEQLNLEVRITFNAHTCTYKYTLYLGGENRSTDTSQSCGSLKKLAHSFFCSFELYRAKISFFPSSWALSKNPKRAGKMHLLVSFRKSVIERESERERKKRSAYLYGKT